MSSAVSPIASQLCYWTGKCTLNNYSLFCFLNKSYEQSSSKWYVDVFQSVKNNLNGIHHIYLYISQWLKDSTWWKVFKSFNKIDVYGQFEEIFVQDFSFFYLLVHWSLQILLNMQNSHILRIESCYLRNLMKTRIFSENIQLMFLS